MLAGMASTKTPRRSAPAPTPVEKATLPTHEQGLALFDQVLHELERIGWERHRVDTLWHVSNPAERRDAPTIRHHYDHGVWELYYEPDKYWNPESVPERTVKIRLDRPLPAVAQVRDELLGITA